MHTVRRYPCFIFNDKCGRVQSWTAKKLNSRYAPRGLNSWLANIELKQRGDADRVGSASRRLLVPRGLFGIGTRAFFFPFPFSKRLWGTRDKCFSKPFKFDFQIRNSIFESAASLFRHREEGREELCSLLIVAVGGCVAGRCVQRAKCFFFSSAFEKSPHARPERRRAGQPREGRGEREFDTGAPGFSPFPGVAPVPPQLFHLRGQAAVSGCETESVETASAARTQVRR